VKEIESLGEGLFELLMPPDLQKVYWEQIKPLMDKGDIKTMLIISDEPWIPWELIKPYLWNDASNMEQKADFLVEQVALSRWLARPLPAELEVTAAALVAPEVTLSNVQAETTFFTELSQQHHVNLQGPLDERDQVIDSLRDGQFQLLHFATHGSFNGGNADQSELTLADGSLTPADLMGGDLRGLRTRRPLVFLNACHSGQVGLSLTGLGGWADKFFREARASAFVGTLWEVSDNLAAEFARSFYTALAEGKTLGEALRTARLQIREKEKANPTWLAYALYGDPNGKVKFG
jgi:CHAT domain-containing protein